MMLIYEAYYKTLGENIAFYRNRRGLTQEQLGEMADTTRVHLSRVENADCAVSLDLVFAIVPEQRVE